MVRIYLSAPSSEMEELAQKTMTSAFEEIHRLEALLSFHSKSSALSFFNLNRVTTCPELQELLALSQFLKELSENSFYPHPTKLAANPIYDLSGIAKGFIVDCAVAKLCTLPNEFSGSVNAGGDIRFFRTAHRQLQLRLGPPERPILRDLIALQDSVATSSPSIAIGHSESSTRYGLSLRKGFAINCSAVVTAKKACIADALTKVVMFSAPHVIQRCCAYFEATAFTFNAAGDLVESFQDETFTAL